MDERTENMAEVIVTIVALILSFIAAKITGDGTAFVGVVMFSVLAIAASIAENRHNGT